MLSDAVLLSLKVPNEFAADPTVAVPKIVTSIFAIKVIVYDTVEKIVKSNQAPVVSEIVSNNVPVGRVKLMVALGLQRIKPPVQSAVVKVPAAVFSAVFPSIVLLVNVSVPALVANVPVVGRVTFVVFVEVKVVEYAPAVIKEPLFTIVNIALDAGGVIVTLFIEVAVAAPSTGVTSVGKVANTASPVPVSVVMLKVLAK